MESLFSIVLPTHNRASFIGKAIKSVIDQLYQKWELIIVDDGSTDNTKEIVLSFNDDRVIYIYQENKERSAARNNGIRNAKGEYICFLDSDDFYHETHLQRFSELIVSKKSSSGLYFSGLSMNEYSDADMVYDISLNNNIEFVLVNSFSTPRACFSTEIAKKHLFDETIRIGEDTELWVRILGEFPLFYHNYRTAIQLEHDERSINADVFYCDLRTKKHILNGIPKKEISNKLRKNILSQCYFNIAKYEIQRGNMLRPMLYLVLSIIKQPNHIQNKFKINLLLKLIFSSKKIKHLIQ
ncbi:glycosyltransferase family 2 protein [Flavobacteriales bacterium]|nr:glycosyltransferase family 2 protein [Flavobacteriales bacterium]